MAMLKRKHTLTKVMVLLAGLLVLFTRSTLVLAQPSALVVAESLPAFQKLLGKWRRGDGGYVLEIRSVESDGKMDAAYFNPRPIRVAKAEALESGGIIKIFIELRDVNYPGSQYSLTYDVGNDRLQGKYFQAVAGETHDVVFLRLKP